MKPLIEIIPAVPAPPPGALELLRQRHEKFQNRYKTQGAPNEKLLEYEKETQKQRHTPKLPLDKKAFQWAVHKEIINIVGDGFRMNEEEAQMYDSVTSYFAGHKSAYDLKKGLYIYGAVGCGKTTLMKAVQTVRLMAGIPVAMYKMASLNDIALNSQEFKFSDYLKKESIFDDAAVESQVIYRYKNETSIMPTLILMAYDLFPEQKIHIVTNLTPKEMVKRENFDERVRSRMNEMFNIICFPGGDRRK